jgi:aspartyl-tRNA(Asn)/glutamyl-tRNA(Gln) amidotransferase subunit C
MERKDIEHLAGLARITLSPAEVDAFANQLPSILEYVGVIRTIIGDTDDTDTPHVGLRHNVLRPDMVIHEPDQFTEDLLAEAPDRQGRFLRVQKILQTDV